MVKNSTQRWEQGQTVKVGFMSLVVHCAIPTPCDGRPDSYLLSNVAGDRLYRFTPHFGCERIAIEEARDLIQTAKAHSAAIAAQATSRAAQTTLMRARLAALVETCNG